MTLPARGMLLVLSAPSGAGKTTLAKRLLASDANMRLSISVTTRAPRTGEQHGTDYYFISDAEFAHMAGNGQLAEHATVHSCGYGTPRADLENRIATGGDVLLDIDWQGGEQLRHSMGADVVSVFIIAPSMDILEQRLRGRGSDTPEVIAKRLAVAAFETEQANFYDYYLVNDDLDSCFADLQAIIRTERIKRRRAMQVQAFLAG